MIGRSLRIAYATAALALAAATAPPQGGTISVAAAPDGEPVAAEIAEAVGEVLGAHGFTLLRDPGHSASIAQIGFRRSVVGEGRAKVAPGRASVSPGVFGGAGGGVSLPLGGARTRAVPLTRFELEVTILRRSTRAVVWHGSAVTVRTDDGGDAGRAAAAALAEGVLRSYPAEPRGVVSVR